MKLCVAQTRPYKGDIQSNIESHKKWIELALSYGADTIIFPELSITGYEPELAAALAMSPDDSRLDVFQEISDSRQVTLGVGVPTPAPAGTCISLALFQPNRPRQLYSKQYLHADEVPYFVSGPSTSGLAGTQGEIALAICYELSVPEHAEAAAKRGAGIYLASVAKSVEGVEKAHQRLAEIASTYAMTVLMANCVGHCDNFDCGGRSAVWNKQGVLVGELTGTDEGILIFDTETQGTTELRV
ncbi:carbon-nitrogen hydrolase family protein [Telluribacter sp.]|jgi:predicted amidohydrolase|uniref:carbon-nitrogen hydrolase family protein n=1 Tax=Telluribacter sp. TaxID=1978767 RepID=UPI002E0E4AFD|nr:carbon-nitrogen hydrolase family protein [Telluribacter sp.]